MKKFAPTSAWLATCMALYCALAAAPAMSASFDCSKEGSANEKIICNDPQLSAMDDQLAKIFKQARKKSTDRRAFNVASDQQWIWREKNCHDRACLLDWYGKRQAQLQASLDAAVPAVPATPAATAKMQTKPADTAAALKNDAAARAALAPSAQAALAKLTGKTIAAVVPAPPESHSLQLGLTSTQIAGIAPEGAAARPHYLSANKGEYLYADPDTSDNSSGTVSVHFLGTEHGQYIIETKRNNIYVRYTCSDDCSLIGQLQLPGDVEKDLVIIKNDHTSLVSQIVADALNGLLAESGVR